METVSTQACVVGGGPAGMMLGLLLARAGVQTVVLEKHADFLRDFRGDTIHPSTLDVMDDLGLLDAFLELPHQKVETLTGFVEDEPFMIADLRHVPTKCRFIALMPQWDFLDFLADEAERYDCFRLIRRAEAKSLLRRGDRVVGVRADTADGPLEVRADLVVGADGRRSAVRADAGLEVESLGAPMDVLWFRLARRESDGSATGGRFTAGGLFVTINRGDYWQCAYVIPKGQAEALRGQGMEAFRAGVMRLAPFFEDRIAEIGGWGDVSLLSVTVDRLKRWHAPGVLCIGDAAHAMSPIGGVGVNLAIQDAVAAANILWEPLLAGRACDDDLARVESRRIMPTRLTRRLQVLAQDNIISPVLARRERLEPPLALKAIRRFPWLARLPARMIGVGFRPERVTSPAAAARRP